MEMYPTSEASSVNHFQASASYDIEESIRKGGAFGGEHPFHSPPTTAPVTHRKLPASSSKMYASGTPDIGPLVLQSETDIGYNVKEVDYEFSQVTFHFSVFFWEFFFHMVDIPSYPLMFFYYKVKGMQNRLFLPRAHIYSWLVTLLQFTVTMLVYTVNIVYFIYSPQSISPVELLFLDLLVATRCATIASKYAYYPKPLLNEMKRRLFTAAELSSFLLLFGWKGLKPELIRDELAFAEVRSDIDLHPMRFVVDDANRRELSCRLLCYQLVADTRRIATPGYVQTSLAISHSLVASFARWFFFGTFFGATWDAYYVSLAMIFLYFFFLNADVGYALVGYDDLRRRLSQRLGLTRILRNEYLSRDQKELLDAAKEAITDQRIHHGARCTVGDCDLFHRKSDLRINFSVPRNVVSWMHCHRVLQDFGRLFSLRLQLFIAFWLICGLGIFAYVAVEVFSSTRIEDIDKIATVMLVFDCVIFITIAFLLLYVGSLVNERAMFDVGEMRKIQLKEVSRNPDEVGALDVVCENIMSDQEISPLTILGIPATKNTLSMLASVLFSLFGALIVAVVQMSE
eukprot:TRINITY_DN51130_c0_g1_i1.p1 TRINITY_DN51130_c0_g1~~TRINITY_DN51130_c0_g1_i1.p1  ORF type:complete len:571 (-),score=110.69 TRINITY_DN51130_c0_g1_i1:61-1773(-)